MGRAVRQGTVLPGRTHRQIVGDHRLFRRRALRPDRQFRQDIAVVAIAQMNGQTTEPNMTTWLPRWFALLVLLRPFVSVAAAPDDTEIARLVKQLGKALMPRGR